MNELSTADFSKVCAIYNKYFSLNYLNSNMGDKLACIALTCYITNELIKKGQNVTCYDTLLKVGKDFPDDVKNTFLKSLGAICQDLMYGCDTFLDFGIEPKKMPKTLQGLLNNYVPF